MVRRSARIYARDSCRKFTEPTVMGPCGEVSAEWVITKRNRLRNQSPSRRRTGWGTKAR